MREPIHVAVGVIRDRQGNVLLTRRARQAHQGGLWEFPGGKLEMGEDIRQALRRELLEELGLEVEDAEPLIKIRHDYGDRLVLLDVWDVTAYSGVETACEGQAMRWTAPARLADLAFPAANVPIVKAVILPRYYAILEGDSISAVLHNCERILQYGVKLMQFRVKSLVRGDVAKAFDAVLKKCRQQQALLLINSDLSIPAGAADGVHLSSRCLMAANRRPGESVWVSASCHNLAELKQAESLNVDFAVLAPVQTTQSHPGVSPLGWNGFTRLLEQVNLPVFALGGLGLSDLDRAKQSGAQGLAGISAFLGGCKGAGENGQ